MPDDAGLPAAGGTTGALWEGAGTLVAGIGELALLAEPESTGAGKAGEGAGEVPTGAIGLEAGIGELPEPDEGPTGTT